jgi:hypothetical protein
MPYNIARASVLSGFVTIPIISPSFGGYLVASVPCDRFWRDVCAIVAMTEINSCAPAETVTIGDAAPYINVLRPENGEIAAGPKRVSLQHLCAGRENVIAFQGNLIRRWRMPSAICLDSDLNTHLTRVAGKLPSFMILTIALDRLPLVP